MRRDGQGLGWNEASVGDDGSDIRCKFAEAIEDVGLTK